MTLLLLVIMGMFLKYFFQKRTEIFYLLPAFKPTISCIPNSNHSNRSTSLGLVTAIGISWHMPSSIVSGI